MPERGHVRQREASSPRAKPERQIASNELQDEVGIAAQHGKRIQEFLDLLTGVQHYSPANLANQGLIRVWFAKDLIRHQFLFEFEDLIQEFLGGAFRALPTAVPRGTLINTEKGMVPTQRNIISRCQYIARLTARAYINDKYRGALAMFCTNCGRSNRVNADSMCSCGTKVKPTHMFVDVDDLSIQDERMTPEDIANVKQTQEVCEKLTKKGVKLFQDGSRAQQIFAILTDPWASKAMCLKCTSRSRVRVVTKEGKPRSGLRVLDQEVKELSHCDAVSYDPTQCTNTRKNIAAHLGVSASLVQDKIRYIRERVTRFLVCTDTNDVHDSLLNQIGLTGPS